MLGGIRTISEYRFVAIMLLATTIFLAVILAAAILVDPYGIFGLRLVEPLVLTNRDEKLSFLRAMDPPPAAIALGSSRVFLLDPDRIERLTGLRAFNASVSYARPEEYLAMTRYIVEDLGIKPKLIIIGANVGELNHDPIDPQTITNSKLRRYLPISKKEQMATMFAVLKERFNPAMVRDIFVALFYRARGYPEDRVSFLPNGRQDFDPALSSDHEKIARRIPSAVRLFAGETELSTERKRYFRDFVEFAKKHNIEVRIAILPMPPIFVDVIEKETHYRALYEEFATFLKDVASGHANLRIFDTTSFESYEGDPWGFNDPTHPNADTIDRITDLMLADYK